MLALGGLLVGALWFLPRFVGPPVLGQAILAVTFLYGLLLVMAASLGSQQHELRDAVWFLIPLSLCQLLPDAMLVRTFGVLNFPDLGAPRMQSVPWYMGGLWVAPLLVVIWLAELAHARSAILAMVVAALASVVVFGAAEYFAPSFKLWTPRNVWTVRGVAPYVLVAETALGVTAWLMFTQVQGRAVPVKVLGAAAVSVFYAGALIGSLHAVRLVR
ncbi:MAG TPA: hypothetical protein VM240_05590 [Verrucomicrobiae bacterium]|nr:hypothetical protein [Verrucomicrobiae bacterium]